MGVFLVRGNCERWCPFGAVEALHLYVTEGAMPCSLGVSCFFVLGGVLGTTLLLRRAFCGWVCPLGTIFDWLQAGARRLGLRPRTVPTWLDWPLGLLKYPLLAVILYFTYRTGELVLRGYDPCYVLLSRHGADITVWAYVVTGVLVGMSVLLVLPFCRWLCPLAAVLAPFSRVGLARVRRDEGTCLDCDGCSEACPVAIPVAAARQVTAARCLGCLECLEACPARAEGALTWGGPSWLGSRWPRALMPILLLGGLGLAVGLALALPLPSYVQARGELPGENAVLEHQVQGLRCRGTATLFTHLLFRDDLEEVEGPLRLEAWPAPDGGRARITYDPARTDPSAIRRALLTPFYDPADDRLLISPFTIEGHDLLEDLDLQLPVDDR